MPENDTIFQKVLIEQSQSHPTRRALYAKLRKALGRPIVSYFTSFVHPVMVDDTDVDMLEGVLQKLDCSKGLALLISTPGGDGLAAERMINVCRSYSGTGEYWAVVPSKAKSAGTIVCLGASKILMGPSSELGPIDPQTALPAEGHEARVFSVYNLVRGYDNLFNDATQTTGKLEPYLQQLQRYDHRTIEEYRQALALSEDIGARALASGMMRGTSPEEIKNKIAKFLTPEETKTHGRAIYRDEAKECGLNIANYSPGEDTWQVCYELYVRISSLVSTRMAKCIESSRHSFSVAMERQS